MNFADAICERDLVAGDREPDPLHCIAYDDPSASHRRTAQKTECGVWARPSELAPHVDDVTCSKCLRILEVREETTF